MLRRMTMYLQILTGNIILDNVIFYVKLNIKSGTIETLHTIWIIWTRTKLIFLYLMQIVDTLQKIFGKYWNSFIFLWKFSALGREQKETQHTIIIFFHAKMDLQFSPRLRDLRFFCLQRKSLNYPDTTLERFCRSKTLRNCPTPYTQVNFQNFTTLKSFYEIILSLYKKS